MIKNGIRMLAAIMFTDIVGYTALMQENETKAKRLRDRQREVIEDKILNHQGRILQYYGDGTLIIFGSAIEAAECAVEIQQELGNDLKVPLRIGLHLGDVVYDDEGIYGDGVNVASRIETLGHPYSVLVSDRVYDELKNHPKLKAQSLGEFALKNVKRPIEIFAIDTEGLHVPLQNEVNRKSNGLKSIAVLPFVNMSGDTENEYFSDGITEELLNALSRVEGLQVTSRTSSFAFKNKHEDIREIGKKLNVKTVLEGSVRKAQNRVRITAQLINTSDGYHLWSETFDRNLEDIFAVQDEISKMIATRLREKLSGKEHIEPLVKIYTNNIEAYNLFLKSLFYWNKWTPDGMRQAIDCLHESIKLDPNFPLPYAGLSNCYVYLGATGNMLTKIAYPKAKEYSQKAIKLDDSLWESHAALALVKLFFDWDWSGAEKSFDRALKINSGASGIHHSYSLYLTAMGRFDEAVKETEIAQRLDPLSLPINLSYGDALLISGRFDKAIEQYKRTLEIDPEFRAASNGLGFAYLEIGKLNEALQIFLKNQKRIGNDLKGVTPLAMTYAKMGEKQKVYEYIEKLKEREKTDENVSLHLDYALIYISIDEYDKAFEYVERAIEDKLGGLVFMKYHPFWRKFVEHPRFKKVEERLKLS